MTAEILSACPKLRRLTRSLTDFAKIVEILDARGASFVSVTQQFNTTTSMGIELRRSGREIKMLNEELAARRHQKQVVDECFGPPHRR